MGEFKKIGEARQSGSEKMKKNGLFDTDRMFCDLYCFEPGQAQAVHSHVGSDKIYLVMEGKGLFQIGEDERELGKDDIALAPSGQSHGVKNTGGKELGLLVFMAPKPQT